MKVTGTINADSYVSMEKYMMPTWLRLLFLALLVAGDGALIALTILQKDLTWLLWLAAWTALCWFLYKWIRRNILNNVLVRIPGIKEGKGFDLELSFDEDALRVHNRSTNVDTAMAWEVFGSMAETKECLALFTKTGTYLLVPKNNLPEEKKQQLTELLKKYCPGLRKRR